MYLIEFKKVIETLSFLFYVDSKVTNEFVYICCLHNAPSNRQIQSHLLLMRIEVQDPL